MWHRADLGITLNGADVSAWADQHTSGFDWAQATASKQPLYNATDAGFNGHASITFDGVDEVLRGADHTGLTVADGFFILRANADPPAGSVCHMHVGSGSTPFYSFTDSNVYESWGQTARPSTGNPTVDLTTLLCYRIISEAAAYTTEINGAQHYTLGSNTVGWKSAAATTLGGNDAGSVFFAGRWAEYLVYDHALSAGDLTTIEAYFNTRYGIVFA